MLEIQGCRPVEALIGDSPAIHRISDQLQKAALTEVPVLITGESGTGKELAARLLHNLSARRSHSFLKVSCPAIPDQLFESELFGHEPGAFTGATGSQAGKCEQADKGTLFLDEIGELNLALQPKLLHALQDFRVVRLGAVDERAIDIRLVCATNRDLEAEVAKGGFRTDLFYRINVIRVQMPSLRERVSDIPILMNHFVKMYSAQFGGTPAPLHLSFMKSLESYHWPGNIRELENMAKRYVVLGGDEHILSLMREPEELRPLVPEVIDLTTPLRVQTKRAIQHLERKIILGVLEAHKWNRRKTAHSLDISYRTLLYKIKEVGLPVVQSANPPQHKLPFRDLQKLPGINDFR
ncbi:sigma-54-dependent Fis family transcriptional regulator [Granulicella sp. L60]|uniref:sigma-54 interaction domain-containing protein n=1 Tax=Granulicella sp. L60 TaxID=1641866 RepID=UPI00131AF9E6|nr:sigma-54 dependent transcriptional regulator [Granulicella sp. L60]